jgi:hypothetical protein
LSALARRWQNEDVWLEVLMSARSETKVVGTLYERRISSGLVWVSSELEQADINIVTVAIE